MQIKMKSKDKDIYTKIYMILYCVCIASATIIRWMNYVNALTAFVGIICIIKTKKIRKEVLNFIWMIFIAMFPLLDAAIRGEAGLSLFTFLQYLPALLLLTIGLFDIVEYRKIWLQFIKGFAWLQIFGMLLSSLWNRIYIMIAWRVLGQWSYAVTGFTTDPTMVAYIVSMAIGIYCVEYIFEENKRNKETVFIFVKMVVMCYFLIETGKRSLLIATIVVLMLCVLMYATNSKKKFFSKIFVFPIIITVLGGICILAYRAGYNNSFARIGGTIIGMKAGDDVSNMRSTWAEYLKMWSKGHELFGIGWESFKHRILATPYYIVPNAHNVYKQILCEEGYIGFLIFILILLATIIYSIKEVIVTKNKENKKLAIYAMYGVLFFIIYSYSGNAIYDSTIYLYFFGSVQLCSSVMLENKKDEKQMY